MNTEEYKQLKDVLEELTKESQNENLTQEQRQEIEHHIATVSGQLLSIWIPIGITRKILMASFFLIGLLGFFTQYEWLIYLILIAGLFSPRLTGEISYMLGRMSKKD
jgi:hypothetical protein